MVCTKKKKKKKILDEVCGLNPEGTRLWHDYIFVFETKCYEENRLVGSQRDFQETVKGPPHMSPNIYLSRYRWSGCSMKVKL